ncbi:adenine nucleotide alpha hydrolase family protein [Vallitalea okinawensis]|uniref:hypothetical protein n=1 Tax=Vallitalea okinawensis TaxID=2078660 RepID=UPI000CFC21DB|nr:hypothetical protein [Vallitalea okinawensis]
MKILNCFKVIEDLDKMTKDDWQIAGRLFVDTSFIKTMLNESDASAIELALRLRDDSDGETNVYGITITDKKVRSFIKQLYGLKYDEVAVCNSKGEDLRFRPDIISRIIADYAIDIEADIITFGSNAPNGNNFLTPFYAAEILDMKCVSNVIDVRKINDQELMITQQGDIGMVKIKVSLPIVLIVENAPGTTLRIPTLKDKMQGSKKEVYEIDMDSCKVSSINVMKPVKLSPIDNSRNHEVIKKEELIQLIGGSGQ